MSSEVKRIEGALARSLHTSSGALWLLPKVLGVVTSSSASKKKKEIKERK